MMTLLPFLCLFTITFAQRFPLLQSYTGLDFFNQGFDFYSGYDPTFGYVHYVDLPTAEQHNMVNLANVSATGIARWGVETVDVLDPNANLGRMSIRLQSAATYKHGLFVLDVAHIPGNICGAWPAFWMVGTGVWPTTGEIDIIETTNNGPNNIMSMHSALSPNCTIAGTDQSGLLLSNDCAYADSYTGCAVSAPTSGTALNAAGGGVYAMLWTSEGIQMWSFVRNLVPPSLRGAAAGIQPNLAEFGLPTANFQGSCDFDAHFGPQQLIFNTDFCGSNAGQTFQMDGCPMAAAAQSWGSCNIYVAANPSAFTEAYWEVNYLNIYSVPPNVVAPLPAPASPAAELMSSASATWPASWTVPAPYSPAVSIPRPTPTAANKARAVPEADSHADAPQVEMPHRICLTDMAGSTMELIAMPTAQNLGRGADILDSVQLDARPIPQPAHTERSGASLDLPTPWFSSPTYWFDDHAMPDRIAAHEADVVQAVGLVSPDARPVPQTARTERPEASLDLPTPWFPSPTHWPDDLAMPNRAAARAAEVTHSFLTVRVQDDREPGTPFVEMPGRSSSKVEEGADSAAASHIRHLIGLLCAAALATAMILW